MFFNLTNKDEFQDFIKYKDRVNTIGIVNYELTYRRPEPETTLKNFTLLLDESSLFKILPLNGLNLLPNLNPKILFLLFCTPPAGKYEKLLTQIHL